MTSYVPRSGQIEALAYRGGRMGISAVPGSGKTHTLAELAATLVESAIGEEQEVLVVTLVNSAVDNLKRRINRSIDAKGLLPGFGYRVRTLHGLAHDIVRERPGLVDLSEDFGIIDEREAEGIRRDAADAWLSAHPDAADEYLSTDLEASRLSWIRRGPWADLVHALATTFIKQAKNRQLTPNDLIERIQSSEALAGAGWAPLSLARMGAEIYADYQRSLAFRGVVDFDDLVRLALQALERDPEYLARLRHRWPFILEDEAQDSSETQEKILRLLAGEAGSWVRVGDSNQAIYETFTNADPEFLRRYVWKEPGVNRVILNESGRSQRAIIDLANYLVDWTTQEHPNEEVRNAFDGLHIIPTQAGDPQPNPPYNPASVQLIEQDLSPTAELKAVADSLQRWVPQHPEQTVAVLVPRNERGFELIELLRKQEIPFVELLRSTTATRHTAGSIGNVLRCLADPTSARRLADAFRVWRRDDRADPELHQQVQAVAKRIASCPAVEAYLWPRADHDWLPLAALGRLPSLDEPALDESAAEMALLCGFRDIARRWQRAAMSVSIDQLILTIAADLFSEQADLALAFKLASLLRDVAAAHPSYRLVELAEELATIAHNERKFIGFSSDDLTFEPPKGRVTVTTIHKAKGLEWDRVYLTSVNNYDFPSGRPGDTYIAEKWFVRDRLNLEAEALAQLKVLAQQSATESYREGEATQKARRDYVAERLRLLYVGITRAKKELIITWNTGRARPEGPRQPAEPLIALQEYHRRTRDMLPDPARPKELAADG